MEVIVKNTLSERVYMPLYQPAAFTSDLNSFIPASATVDMIADGNMAFADLIHDAIFLERVNDGTLNLVLDGVILSTAESIKAFAIINGTPSNDNHTASFLNDSAIVIALNHAGHPISENIVKALGISFKFTIDGVVTGGTLSAVKSDSGWFTKMPILYSDAEPNETLSFDVTVDGSGILSLTITGNGTGESVSLTSLTILNFGI